MSNPAAQQDLSSVRDFPDRLPAMVVKELRQGLRGKLFGEIIAGFHLVLVAVLLPALSFGEASEIRGTQRLLWWIFIGVLVVLLPLRGLSALIQERRENTFDTLLLTRLSAGRIVWGKWLAITAQIAVTGMSFVPYAIMVYAAGGVALNESLAALLRLGLLAAVLTAAYVAFSWNAAWLWRAGPALILTWLALTQYAGPMVRQLTGGADVFAEISPLRLLAETAAAAALIFLTLEATASRVAPWTEDHRTGPRLLGLALPLLLAAGASHPDWMTALHATALTGLTLVSLTALTEPWPGPPRAARPGLSAWNLRARGLPSGWPHGVVWALAAWGLLVAVTRFALPSDASAQTVRLAAWLFSGRLLLFLFPASGRNQPTALLATALVFFLLQTILSLSGELLDLPALSGIAASVPGLFPGPGPLGTPQDAPLIAAAAAASCALLAGLALLKHHFGGKEAVL